MSIKRVSMINMKNKIIIAIPRGRIIEECKKILNKTPFAPDPLLFDKTTRKLTFKSKDPNINYIKVRAFDVCTFVAFGAAQIGIAGDDVIQEYDYSEVYAPLDLNIGHCRLSVAAPNNFLKKDKKFTFIKKDLAKSTTNIMLSDIVIHGAGYAQPQKFIENSMQTLLLNSLTTYELLKKTKKNGSFIFLSSSEIYSGLIGNIVEERIGLTNTLHPRACYIEGKRFGETLINTFKNKHNINAKAVRVCLAYGPGVKKNDKRVMSQFIDKALTEKEIQLLDSGSAIRSYVYISDVIKMIIDVLISSKDTIYNVGGKSKITIYQLAKEIGKITNVKVVKKKEINKNSAPKSAFVSSSKYEKEFGKFKLTAFSDGISRTIKWQKLLKSNLK